MTETQRPAPYSKAAYTASAEAAVRRIAEFEAAASQIHQTLPAAAQHLLRSVPSMQEEHSRLRACATGEGAAFPLEAYGLDDNRYFEVRDANSWLIESFSWSEVKSGDMQRFMDRLAESAQPGRQLRLA